jgi:thiol-disulfide isomerase/thioredoxin
MLCFTDESILRIRPRLRPMKSFARVLAWGLVGALGLAAASWSQAAFTISDFAPVGYMLKLDGQAVDSAEVFQSRAAGAFLIVADELPAPIMIKVRDAQVQTVDLMKVNRLDNGNVELLPNATLAHQGTFQVSSDRTAIEFDVDGQSGELREKPPLIGMQTIPTMFGHSPEYQRGAEEYQPSDPILTRLKDQPDNVEVRVFFGSWCSACKQMVPRIIKVAEKLEGSKITFNFYGLPHGITGDPEAQRFEISSVPTGVIFRSGKEIGRISGGGWKIPELAINNLLVNPDS